MPENQNIEWKSKWRDDYLEWICGFANAQGGTIYIGIDDDGHVTGLTNTKKLLEDIPNKVRNAMGIVVDVDLLSEDGNEYIKITIPPYPVAVSCKGVYYYRSGSTLQTLSGPELERFILRKRGATWDNMPLTACLLYTSYSGFFHQFQCLFQCPTGKTRLFQFFAFFCEIIHIIFS